MKRFKAIIQYDGTDFVGYQIQPNGRTVQEEIEKALQRMHKGTPVKIVGSGRTDTGVHAKGQVIHFDSPLLIPPDKYRKALQTYTPYDISFVSVEEVASDFHARFGTTGKEYRYFVSRSAVFDPFARRFALHYPFALDIAKMREAADVLTGKHDFTSFCAAGSGREDKVRTIYAIDIIEDGDTLTFSFKGNGFLYNMVRILVGTLLDVGNGRLGAQQVKVNLEAQDRTKGAKTASPQGLFLWEVYYD
ncbi:tRNA pseudouridine(38-40) synthase TruA [Listeria booriae]|uniref:tRNA pseudouridine(38-40) synthase TruA n=1 Tax=Listeria booriae TaxID=1552123 RepID=UPI0016241538|nr:tRNA pseudouridine(38-40) synthase TruA [Listeria booriae]MBC1504965.1 tRNA pseudouridine(38-40) synthase TruA [Listeria booriae]MBC1531689.1 tRNA pseudouridine(38-40) synthase TruA [Listeria booriae]